MLNTLMNTLLSGTTATAITFGYLLACTGASIGFGLIISWIYMFRNNYSKSFVVTLALLPAIIQLVIMLVNGNVGTGVAVMGAFSLVRFRSIPGSARDIGTIFFAMAIGLATGMGYLAVALLFVLIIGMMTILLNIISFGEKKSTGKMLKITIPENLDYTGLFDDLFKEYTENAELVKVKTTNMGSLYELHYHINMKNEKVEKEFLDEIRCRNGNLNIICGKIMTEREEL